MTQPPGPGERRQSSEVMMVGAARPAYGTPADCVVKYVERPFTREPDFGATSANYDFAGLLAWAEAPR